MTAVLPKAPGYVPYKEVGNSPNIIVDGAPLASTVLTLSHWPNNQTDASLRRDTSTATVFAYLDTPALHQDVPIVSNNHFDEDGLFSMFGLIDPETALEHRQLLTGAALAGDFGVCDTPEAARLCFIVESFGDPDDSPLPAATFVGCERRRVEALYRSMLERMPALAGDVDAWESLWSEQYRHLEDSADLIERGTVTIAEYPDEDLAVVTIPPDLPERTVRRYLEAEQAAVHPFAIHTRTMCNRIVRLIGGRYEFQYRYESWVQLASYRPALRVDLTGLAEQLCELETGGGEWIFEGVNEVAPRLRHSGSCRSSIAADAFLTKLCDWLRTQPPAWNPYSKPD